jgi:transposase
VHLSQCGGNRKPIGYECSERLAIKPIETFVELTKLQKRACARCKEAGVSTAPAPAALIEKGVLADSLVA